MNRFFGYLFIMLSLSGVCPGKEVRIVSLAPALTEIVCMFDSSTLVGRSEACIYPEKVKNLPSVGRFGIPELERILQLKPSWVIGNDLMNRNIADKLRSLNIEVTLHQINTFEDYIFWLKFIGSKLGKAAAAESAVKTFEQQKQHLQQLPAFELKALWVVNSKPLIVAGSGSLPDAVMQLVKIENAAGKVPEKYFKCSAEWLLSNKFDLVIWNVPGVPEKNSLLWKNVPAVQKKRVILLDVYDPVTCPGPRCLEAVLSLRKKIEAVKMETP